MLDKRKLQEALNRSFDNSDYLIMVSYLKKNKDVEIKKQYVLKEVEAYIESVKKIVEAFHWDKQEIKYIYTIVEFEKIYVATIVIEKLLDRDKMNGIFEWVKVRNIKELEHLGSYLLKDKPKDIKYSKEFFKGINI